MLYIIGLGLYGGQDLSLRTLDVLKNSDRVYAELNTSIFPKNIEDLEGLIGKEIIPLDRKDIEKNPEENLFKDNKGGIVSLLVLGDPTVATTHIDLVLRARILGIETRIINSSSVYSTVSSTVSKPYKVIRENLKIGLHTLILPDIKSYIKRT